MANIKISDLAAATSVAAGDLFEVSQGSGTLTSRKATGTQVQSFVLGSYAGASTITTLGTISTGTWQGTAVAVVYGGTGATTAAAARTNLGAAASGANSDITSLAGLTTALSVAQGGTGAADAATARTNLGLAIGSNVQAYDAELAAIAGLTSAADRLPYFTGSGTAALATFTAFGRSLVDNADAATARTTLGLGTVATMTGPSGAIVGTTDTQTLSNKRVSPRTSSVTASGIVTPTGDTADQYEIVATGALTIAAPSGTPTNGQRLIIRIKNNGTVTSQTITWTTTAGAYRVIGVTLPAATPTSATTGVHYVGCIYNAADGFWDVLAVGTL